MWHSVDCASGTHSIDLPEADVREKRMQIYDRRFHLPLMRVFNFDLPLHIT
jgi:hypothetical protein